MKGVLPVIFCICSVFNNTYAQKVVDSKSDTSVEASWVALSIKYNKPLFVLDGKPLGDKMPNSELNKIDSNNIFDLTILKDSSKESVYGHNGYGAIIITTKEGAKKAYQNKLSGFSKEYHRYLQEQKNKDDSVAYVIDGMVLTDLNDESIRALYSLPKEKIVKVLFTKNPWLNGNKSKYLATITTRQ